MDPYLKGLKVIVSEEGASSTLMNRGSFGTVMKGGGLHLDLVEAAYLVENDRILVRKGRRGAMLEWDDIIEIGSSSDPSLLARYVVYRDLRNRGMVARQGGEGHYLFYPRGTKGMKAMPSGWVSVFSEDDAISPTGLLSRVIVNDGMRMRTLYAIVDSDYDVTYYTCHRSGLSMNEKGDIEALLMKYPSPDPIGLRPLGGSGSVAFGERALALGDSLSIGTRVKGSLLLSREESMLMGEISGGVRSEDDLRYRVYRDLTLKGHRVRSGLKYGCHFRAYLGRASQEHSAYLIQCMDPDERTSWEELSRAIRLCHSVRKKMIIAFETLLSSEVGIEATPNYLEIAWHRP